MFVVGRRHYSYTSYMGKCQAKIRRPLAMPLGPGKGRTCVGKPRDLTHRYPKLLSSLQCSEGDCISLTLVSLLNFQDVDSAYEIHIYFLDHILTYSPVTTIYGWADFKAFPRTLDSITALCKHTKIHTYIHTCMQG